MNRSLTAIQGVKVGHAQSEDVQTGVTVVLFDRPYTCSLDARGGWPSVYESESSNVGKRFYKKDAIFFCGGDVIGFDTSKGIRKFLMDQKRDSILPGELPSITGAGIYDVTDKRFYEVDYEELGYLASQNASQKPVREGSIGAGFGATVGKLMGRDLSSEGGIGSYNLKIIGGYNVGCIVVTNSLGNIYDTNSNKIIAGTRNSGRGDKFLTLDDVSKVFLYNKKHNISKNVKKATTLGIVVTDAALSHEEIIRLSTVAHDGLARAIKPVHMSRDGDTIFAVSTGKIEISEDRSALTDIINEAACDCLSEAIVRSVSK